MTMIPILLYWGLAIWGLCSRRPVLLYLFFALLPLGAFAVVPPSLTAGLTFVPAPMTALLLILKTMSDGHRLRAAIAAALDPRRLGLLLAFLVVAIIVTLFMPRLFAGSVMVISMRGDASGPGPLFPTAQNVSQLAYLTISVMVVFAFTQVLKTPETWQTALHAVVLCGTVTVATGILDLAAQHVPITPLLDLFRTATYSFLLDGEILGVRRVVGLMPEASAFGSLCLAMLCLLYFLRRAIRDDRIRDVYTPPLILALLLFAWLSTSSATYVGLGILAVMAVLEWVFRFLETRYSRLRRRHLTAEFLVVFGTLLATAALMLVKPDVFDFAVEIVDRMVFQKTDSSSFVERNMWTTVSLGALVDTYGVGVGLGGTRASNSVVAVFSSVGVVGALFYFGFIMQSLLRRAAPGDEEGRTLISAMRYAFVPTFVVGLLIGTTADFGALGAFRYGLLSAIGFRTLYLAAARRRPVRTLAGAL